MCHKESIQFILLLFLFIKEAIKTEVLIYILPMNAKSISCIVFFLNLPGKLTQNNKKGIVFIFLKGGEPSYKIVDYNNGGGVAKCIGHPFCLYKAI